jgi:hypothetical protein
VDLDLRYLLLSDAGRATARSLEEIAQTVAAMTSLPTTDREYIELKGCIRINRWVDDDRLSSIMAPNGIPLTTDPMRLGDSNIPLRLQGSIYSAMDERSGGFLAEDEVCVQVKALELPYVIAVSTLVLFRD